MSTWYGITVVENIQLDSIPLAAEKNALKGSPLQ